MAITNITDFLERNKNTFGYDDADNNTYDTIHLYHGDYNYQPSHEEMNFDNSNMDKEIASNMSDIRSVAKYANMEEATDKPFYDWKTRNKSFIRVYKELQTMGIKHNKFHLRLIDKGLQGIDPYQAILPMEIQLRIIYECIRNPWYWLREVCRIPQDGMPVEPGGGVQYILDRNNLACWYLFLNGVDHYQSKPRQRGKTQNALAEQNYAYHFGTTSATFLFFNKDQSLGKTNLYRFKCQRDLLPTWMQMRTMVDENGKIDKGMDNITVMRNPITHNTIKVMPKAINRDSAIRLGRGETAALHHYDECDFIKNLQDIMRSAGPSFGTASKNARDNGGIACRIYTSTPGDSNTIEGRLANEWVNKMVHWKDEMFDYDINVIKKAIMNPRRVRIVYVEHTWRELGLSMEWYEDQCSILEYDEESILREIDLKRIPGMSLSPFKKTDLMYINKHEIAPIKEDDIRHELLPFLFYEPIHREYPYILSCDPAEGLAGDNFAISLINPYTLKVAAEYRSPYISEPDGAKLIEEFMDKYAPKSMIVVENNKGREVIHRLQETKYRYQIYYDIDKLNLALVENTDEYGALKAASLQRRAYGLTTSRATRGKYMGILENIMATDRNKLCTRYLKEDVVGLVKKGPNRKVEAGDGFHDDNIMSYLMGIYVYNNATNLETWGITRGLTEPPAISAGDSPDTIIRKLKNIARFIPDSLKEVFATITDEKDPVTEARKYEAQIQKEMKMTQINNPPSALYENSNSSMYGQDINQMVWDRIDRQIEESNYGNTDVNLDDWLD